MADHVVPVIAQPRPRQVGSGDPGNPAGFGPHLRAAQQRLGRDARSVRALPADQLPLDHRHPFPGRQQPVRGGHPAAAHPNDDHVEPVHSLLLSTVTNVGRPPSA